MYIWEFLLDQRRGFIVDLVADGQNLNWKLLADFDVLAAQMEMNHTGWAFEQVAVHQLSDFRSDLEKLGLLGSRACRHYRNHRMQEPI